MRIAHITAGAGGMYCGSCLHDNTLAAALQRTGNEVALVPIYTPIRTDEENVSIDRIFYGAVNIYLQQHSRLFRHTPWMLDRLLDNPALLAWVARRGATVDARELGALAVSVLEGEEGRQGKELEKLVAWLRTFRPDIVHLSNSMLLGLARRIREETGVPVLCSVQGEDIFLDELPEADRQVVQRLLRRRVRDVEGVVAPSRYAVEQMGRALDLPPDRMHLVHLGLNLEGHGRSERRGGPGEPFRIGYMARICPEKGLHVLIEAFRDLVRRCGAGAVRLEVAGYLGPRNAAYLEGIRRQVSAWDLDRAITFHGEVDRDRKIELLGQVDVLSVPTTYREPKGIFVLEALANGTPVVQPAHGAFPELIEMTGGGILYDPSSVGALADALEEMKNDPARRAALGQSGKAAVFGRFSDEVMAQNAVALYRRLLEQRG